jgi:hypothetical protein
MIPLHVLWGCAFLLSTPFRVACRVLQLQRYQLLTDLVAFCATASVFLLWRPSPMDAMWALVGVAFAQHGGLAAMVWRAALSRPAAPDKVPAVESGPQP